MAVSRVGRDADSNGNLTKDNLNTYTWDPNWGNPASVNGTNLIYDALGQMVEQQVGSTYTQILYSPAGKTAIMNGQTLIKAFVYLPGGETAIYNSSGLAYYRHPDWLGSSRLTSTASQTVYSTSAYAPYGEQYALNGTADASFTGQNADTASTLYDFAFREHSPTQGRWISPDPAGLAAVDPTNPQSWNRYGYVMNQPLGFVDPSGLCGEPLSVTATGVIIVYAVCPNPDPNPSYSPSYSPCGPGLGYLVINGYVICGAPGNLGTILSQVSGQIGGAANNGWSFLGQNSTWWKTFLKEAVQPWKDQCANVFANAFANGGIVNAVSENLEGGPDPDEVIKQAGSMAAAQYVVNNGLVCPGCSSTYRAIVSGTETAATSFVLADAYTRIGQGAYAEISSYLAGQCR